MRVLTIQSGNANHVVFIPKHRRKALYGSLRKHLGVLFRELARHRECEIGEGHLMVDHMHMLLSIPPKYSVSPGVRLYIQEQEKADQRLDQLGLFGGESRFEGLR